jgi:hypothetical protein
VAHTLSHSQYTLKLQHQKPSPELLTPHPQPSILIHKPAGPATQRKGQEEEEGCRTHNQDIGSYPPTVKREFGAYQVKSHHISQPNKLTNPKSAGPATQRKGQEEEEGGRTHNQDIEN